MNILALIKNDDKDSFIVDYLHQNFTHETVQIHLLNIVAISGDIPTKRNGQVLDVCTEFDLTEYLKISEGNQDYLNDIKLEKSGERYSLVGMPIDIVKSYAEDNNIDLIVGGAKSTTLMEDMFMKSFPSRIMENVDVPFLSLKCFRGEAPLKKVAIIRKFENPKQENLAVLKQIISEANAEVSLIRVESGIKTDEEINQKMNLFKDINGITGENRIIRANNLESTLENLMVEEDIDLLVLGKGNGFQKILMNGTSKDIVNHIYAPILIN